MELVHKETTEYENKNWDKTYKYHIDNFDDFIEIIKSLEADYGVVEDILCIKKDKDNKVIDYIEYDTMDELMKKHKNKYNNYDIYKFISKEKYISFIIDMNNNTLIVSSSEGTLGKREKDSNMVEYYQDEYGNIVKYDKNKEMVYTFDNKLNKWVKRRDLRSGFFHYDNDYTLIQYDPFSGLKR